MNKIINFKCRDDLESFINSRTLSFINSGSEGRCYKGKDSCAYKIIDHSYSVTGVKYNPETVISEETLTLGSFAFPKELYVVDGNLYGYKSMLVNKDLFSVDNTCEIKTIKSIDFKKLSKAYKNMFKDVMILSSNHILIDDMPFNVMFDGEKLVAVDTCGYKKVDYDPTSTNIDSLNTSIEMLFRMWFESYKSFDKEIKNNDIDNYLGKVYTALPLSLKKKVKR